VVTSPPASPLDVTCVQDLASLEAHSAAWDALAASLPQCLPMLTHAWVATYLERTEAPEGSWLVLLAYDGDALVGVLAGLVARGVVRVPCDYHTENGDLVLAVGREAEALEALLGELRRRVPRLLGVELGAVREDSPTWVALRASPSGWTWAREPALEGSSFAIEGDAETWFSDLSKNLRSDLKRAANRVRKDGLGEIAFTFEEGAAAAPERLDDLMALEASGWKGEAGQAIAQDEGTETKYRLLAERFARRGMLEWQWLHLGDRLAAANMAVRMGRKLMLLRQGFDAGLSKYAPGNLLLRRAVEREFERFPGGEINLVTDYPWCRRWRMALTPYHHVALAPRRLLPALRRVLPVRLRQLARKTPGVRRLARRLRGSGDVSKRGEEARGA